MKTPLLVIAMSVSTALLAPLPRAEAQNENPYTATDRSAHETVWQRVEWQINQVGDAVARTNQFVEIATGQNFFDKKTQAWQPSREEWQVYPDAIVALAGRHNVILATNLNLGGAVDVLTPEGVRLISNPAGLGFFDPVDGKHATLAEIKDCAPRWGAGTNEIVFHDCFNGIRGSMRYLYTRAGIQQHVILEQRLQLPDGFSDKSRLECYTEFAPATPWPRITTRVLRQENDPVLRARMVEPDFTDSELDFGELAMRAGTAFTLGDSTEAQVIRVGKRFEMVAGRPVLTESVEFNQLEPLLARLAAVERPKAGLFAINSSRQLKPPKEPVCLPREYFRATDTNSEIQLASSPLSQPAVVIDYEFLGSATNKTFNGDTTYYVSGLVSLIGTTSIEGGAIIKFTNLSSAKLLLSGSGSLVCKTGPYRPAIFTSKDDNTVGESIPASTGTPTNYNGATYLDGPNGYTTYEYLRLSYAGTAISAYFPQEVRHCQFIRCGTAISAVDDTDLNVRNVLFSVCGTAVSIGGGNSLVGQHVTADQLNKFFDGPHSTCILTNSILTAVTNIGSNVSLSNCATYFSGSAVYQSYGAASYYLANSSTNRNAGLTNINAALANDLKKMTTFPPYEITTNFTGNTTLSTRDIRDSDSQPDRGYHYAPLEYVVSGRTLTNATLTLTNGVALGTYGASASQGIYVRNNGILLSEGSPTNLNHIGRYNAVQEQSTTTWSASSVAACVQLSADTAVSPQGRFRFTEWSLPGGKGDYYNSAYNATAASFQDCQFGPGSFHTLGATAITNCLWERATVNLDIGTPSVDYYVYNSLFESGSLVVHQQGSKICLLEDNLFDRATLSQIGTITHDHNGYVTNYSRLSPNGTGDVVLTNAPTYQTNYLGKYYYPTNDGMLSRLIDTGSRAADDAGLFHFTTHTNQVKETNSFVDIGYHYVALTNGIPTDTDGDGILDYLDPDSTPLTDIMWSNTVWYLKPASLAWNCWTNALACTNFAPGDFTNMWANSLIIDHRNTNFWFRRFTGWPAYSVWNDYDTSQWPTNTTHVGGFGVTKQGAGVMVSPEHFLTTGHQGFQTNTWLAFMDMSNTVVFRQVQDFFYHKAYLGGEWPNNLTTNMGSSATNELGYDYYIGLLNQPVPDYIGYLRVISTNWWAHFDATFRSSAPNYPYHFPFLIYNGQNRQPGMSDLIGLTCYSGSRSRVFDYMTLTNRIFYPINDGDSGSPFLFVLDGELCLAGLNSSTLDFGGVRDETIDPAYTQARVNATMAELSLRNGRTNLYALKVKDPSTFPVYHPSYQCPP